MAAGTLQAWKPLVGKQTSEGGQPAPPRPYPRLVVPTRVLSGSRLSRGSPCPAFPTLGKHRFWLSLTGCSVSVRPSILLSEHPLGSSTLLAATRSCYFPKGDFQLSPPQGPSRGPQPLFKPQTSFLSSSPFSPPTPFFLPTTFLPLSSWAPWQ